MRKELEVVGGVKSLVHRRCQTVDSTPSHPAAATIYMSMPPACWRGTLHFHSSFFFFGAIVVHHFFFCHLTFSFTSLCLRREGQRSAGCGGGGGHIEFAKSGRTMERKPGRKEDETLPVKCYCLCEGTGSSQQRLLVLRSAADSKHKNTTRQLLLLLNSNSDSHTDL